MKMGTKAETLAALEGRLDDALVLPQISFPVRKWKPGGVVQCIWQQCVNKWGERPVIVRSSAVSEDTAQCSQAGKYESIANVSGLKAFEKAVDTVIASYDDDNVENQVLVQPMLEHIKLCGVAFTVDPNGLGNYYVINYDESGSASAVTSGIGQGGRLLYVFRGKETGVQPEETARLCTVLRQLEELFESDRLDVEFAATADGQLYIFQVRPLCIRGQTADWRRQHDALQRIEAKIRQNAGPKPYLCGNKNIYGVMPDWNPAEMIGLHPKALALSLYQEVITDSVWAYQRDNYGYRNLRSFPLMVDFGGLPYIDVRVSFNSFVPARLDEKISGKLVNYYLERLAAEPSKHDKIEFDIVFSCYTLDLPQRIRVLENYGFSQEEIQAVVCALRDLTNNIINPDTGLWRRDYEKTLLLESRYQEITESDMGEAEKIYWLLEDCKRYGTLPFAGLARGAFIAVQLLASMVKTGVISEQDYQDFMNDVDTVGSRMNQDFRALSRKEFLKKYGHLRPGTYDISSLRYDEASDLYFDWDRMERETAGETEKSGRRKFSLSLEQMHRLKDLLEESGLSSDILGLMDFIKTVIEGREYGKFVFTRSLSRVIQMIGEMGARYGLTRDDCAHLNIRVVRELYASAKNEEETILKSVEEGRAAWELSSTLVLPPVLTDAEEVWRFYYPDTEPNYITMKRAQGEVAVLDGGVVDQDISERIVLIACADPGYDWIFSHQIRGFVTMYGGANSHMAIRAGELGIPAVIGVGEKQYEKYRRAEALEIDAGAKTVRIF